jgi:hypothetical protein
VTYSLGRRRRERAAWPASRSASRSDRCP